MKKQISLILIGTLGWIQSAAYADNSNSTNLSSTTPSISTTANAATHTNSATSASTNATTDQSSQTGPVSGNFDVTNNYVFRGISNSDNNPAVQGGFTYTFSSTGIYLNVWASNVDFLDPQGNTATIEIDTIAGIANNITDDLSYNLSIDRYNYPRASAASYDEGILAVTYKIFTATIGYSTDVYGVHKKGTYYNGAINYNVDPKYVLNFNDVSLMGSVGHYRLPKSGGLLSYSDYMLGIQKKQGQYQFMLQWTGTNGQSHQAPLDGNFVIATIQVNF